MNQVYVKPVEGRIARHEQTNKVLPKRGQWWPDNANTRRLLRAGDIVKATAPQAPSAPEPAHTPSTTAPEIAKAVSPSLQQKIEQARADFAAQGAAADTPVASKAAPGRQQRKRAH